MKKSISTLIAAALAMMNVQTLTAQVAATPLVETFVGQWCPWSPRGIIGMDRMQEKYQDKFVCLLYHIPSKNGLRPGLLTVSPNPHNIVNSPRCVLSREEVVDPYYGNSYMDLAVENDWKDYLDVQVPVEVSVSLEKTSEDVLRATAKVAFVSTPTSSLYRVAFVLVADSVTTEAFDNRSGYVSGQNNGYVGDEKLKGDDWLPFTQGSATVYGVKYNNLVLDYEEPFLGRTLAINPEAQSAYSTTHSFNLQNVTNIYGGRIPVPENRYRVVAIVSDGAGNYVNCAKSGYADGTSGIDHLAAEKDIQSIVYHDIHGLQTARPLPGNMYIETTTYTDGTRSVRKQFQR